MHKSYSILYLGCHSGTSRHRADALQRLGHRVTVLDPKGFLASSSLLDKWIFETGGMLLENFVQRRVLASLDNRCFDFVYVDGGALIGPPLIRELKRRIGKVISYNIDDPYGKRDKKKWRLYLAAVPEYDLNVVVRPCNREESLNAGSRNTVVVSMSSDEVAHCARSVSNADRARWSSDVLFIGTWMPERGPFLARLVSLGVPLTIYGDRWHKSPEWPILKTVWRGPGIYNEDDYALAIQCSKICLGLLSKGNRDLSTTRSFEIPHLGGLLCAERTSTHLSLYREDTEAVFWSTPDECALKCLHLLADETNRSAIARKGHTRCLHNGFTNERMLQTVLAEISALAETNLASATR